MVIAICTDSMEEYEGLAEWAREYGDIYGMRVAARWFKDLDDYFNNSKKEKFPIIILASDGIVNQEVAVSAREISEQTQFVWIGEDRRFALSSFRLQAVNFVLKPATKKDIDISMERCLERLGAAGVWIDRVSCPAGSGGHHRVHGYNQ